MNNILKDTIDVHGAYRAEQSSANNGMKWNERGEFVFIVASDQTFSISEPFLGL